MNPISRRDAAILFIAAFLVLVTGAFWGLPSGKSVAGALVILDGGAPYRDFWTMYAPGQFYAVAALYALFGRQLLLQAVAACLVRAASAVVFLRLLHRVGATRAQAFGASAVFVLMFWRTAPELTDYPLALLFLLLAVDRAVRYFGGGGITHLRWTGAWLGVAAWFKHDISAYITIGIVISLFASWFLVGHRRPAGWASALRASLTVVTAALVMIAPVAIWTAATAGAAAWQDLIVFPSTVFSKVRGEPFPPLVPDVRPVLRWLADVSNARRALQAADPLATWVTLYAPALIFIAGAGVLVWKRRQLDPARLAVLSLGVACSPFFWAAAHVQHNTHPYTLAILAALSVAVMWCTPGDVTGWRTRLRGPVIVGVCIYSIGLMTSPAVNAATVYYEWDGSRVLDLPGLRGIRLPARLYNSYQPLGQFFRAHVPDGEPIYAGLLRHDSIVVNNSLLYAIAGRPACCGYTELHPGVADRAPVQQDIIRRLDAGGVRAVALWQFGWADEVMEARKRHTMAGVADAGSMILDRYIAQQFEVVARYGEYHVLWRRNAPRPPGVTPLPPDID